MFEGQPKGLFALALANTGERFGYYTMLAVFALFLRANYGLSPALAGTIYSVFLMLVYFFPLIGGIMADKFGFGKMVSTGIVIMFAGYLLLSVPLGGDTTALVVMLAALLLIGFGTGLFKGNLQVMVGDLYNDEQYKDKWNSLDHIIVSPSIYNKVDTVFIHSPKFLLEEDKFYGGFMPRRTYKGMKYQKKGFSDHLPLVARFKFE